MGLVVKLIYYLRKMPTHENRGGSGWTGHPAPRLGQELSNVNIENTTIDELYYYIALHARLRIRSVLPALPTFWRT